MSRLQGSVVTAGTHTSKNACTDGTVRHLHKPFRKLHTDHLCIQMFTVLRAVPGMVMVTKKGG